jgi:hypothetical protein
MLRYLPYLLVIALWIYAFVDCLGTSERDVRGLPKVVWLLIILFLGEVMIGPLMWLAVGKRRGPAMTADGSAPSQWHRAGRHGGQGTDLGSEAGPREWIAPDDNPEFLRSLSELNKENRKDGPPSESGGE